MKEAVILVAIAMLSLVPWWLDSRYVYHIATMIVIMAPLALSMSLMMRIGQLSLAPCRVGVERRQRFVILADALNEAQLAESDELVWPVD